MANENEIIDNAVKASGAITDLIKAAGENQNAKDAADNLGKSAVTITSTINNALLPLAAVNYAFDKARKYFTEKFSADFLEKTNSISKNNLIDPDPSVAGPALQGLAFNHENAELKDMYLNLLSASVDNSRSNSAHPAFVDVLSQITPFEAQIIGQLLGEPVTPIARVVLISENLDDTKDPKYPKYPVSIKQHLLNIFEKDTGECSPDPRIELMIDNYCRLGLTTVNYEKSLTSDDEYQWASKHPVFLSVYKRCNDDGKLISNDEEHTFQVGLQFGILEMTAFGKLFALAVGINEIPIHANEA